MDVLEIIKSEHKEVAALIDKAAKCAAGDERLRDLAQQIQTELDTHLKIEERLFYSRLKAAAEQEDEQVDVFEAYTEHAVARRLMEMLATGRKPDERFKAELEVLGESVKHHVKDEESKVFAVAKEYLSDEELEQMGTAWQNAKARSERATSKSTRGTTSPSRRKATSK